MTRRLAAAATALAVLAAGPALAQIKTIKLLSSWDKTTLAAVEGALEFQDQVKRISGGKLEVDIKGPETVPPFQQIQPVSAGVFDMLWTHGVYHAGSKGLTLVVDAIDADLDKRRSAGIFDLDAFVEHVIDSLAAIGPGGHVVAVCQPTVGVLAAVAVMAAGNHIAQPLSMTLMAGPIDARINPTQVNLLATGKPIEWFERNLIGIVPARYAGALRRVYPGFVQLAAFMSMNPERHRKSFEDLYRHLVEGDREKAEPIMAFYHEYFAMMDLPAEFYLETVRAVFQEHLLPRGKMRFRGKTVDPAAIRRTALLTVEGEKDDICSVGQTLAAQELCTQVRPYLRQHHVQTGVGHYGVFNGRRWEARIYPILREFIHASE